MVQDYRVLTLRDGPKRRGDFVLYWMQASQRASCNHALEYAIHHANAMGRPLVVLFGITPRYPEANARHYTFMLEGLRETGAELRRKGIAFVLRRQSPEKAAVSMSKAASLLVADRGYLRVQRAWRKHVAEHAHCPVVQVESDVVVPVDLVSQKEEYAAATIRRKIQRHLKRFLVPLKEGRVRRRAPDRDFDGVAVDDVPALLKTLRVARSVKPVETFRGGTSEARRRLADFARKRLKYYAEQSNDPGLAMVSDMSPYLHFGQISPLEIALAVDRARGVPKASVEAYLEQLIVRRELSMNFVLHNPHYDAFESVPDWARNTLQEHAGDPREYVYTPEVFEQARTHDPYWNAAQREMVATGKMHNYMRMYWGKKILEWSRTPEEAFVTALALNNKYELDGRDPNGFTGVAWCFGKHDRAWTERPVFGKTRYMNAAGLRRKFDIEAYVRRVEALRGDD